MTPDRWWDDPVVLCAYARLGCLPLLFPRVLALPVYVALYHVELWRAERRRGGR